MAGGGREINAFAACCNFSVLPRRCLANASAMTVPLASGVAGMGRWLYMHGGGGLYDTRYENLVTLYGETAEEAAAAAFGGMTNVGFGPLSLVRWAWLCAQQRALRQQQQRHQHSEPYMASRCPCGGVLAIALHPYAHAAYPHLCGLATHGHGSCSTNVLHLLTYRYGGPGAFETVRGQASSSRSLDYPQEGQGVAVRSKEETFAALGAVLSAHGFAQGKVGHVGRTHCATALCLLTLGTYA